MRSQSSGRGKRSLIEKFELYFGKSTSVKVAICLGVAIVILMASLLFMYVFTPGSVADAQDNVSSAPGNASPAPSDLTTNTGLIDANLSMANNTYDHVIGANDSYLEIAEHGDGNKRFYSKYVYGLVAAVPSVTPTPMVAPKLPLEVLWDQPFYESVKPIQDYDRKKLIVYDSSYRFDNGPLLLDPAGTYGGALYAYPGDTIGIKLHIYNNGELLSTVARVDITLLKMNESNDNVYMDTGVDLHYDMAVDAEESTGMEKSILINVPENNSDSAGYYRITVKIYVNDTLSSDMSKEFNVL